jgi:hypothetical protein
MAQREAPTVHLCQEMVVTFLRSTRGKEEWIRLADFPPTKELIQGLPAHGLTLPVQDEAFVAEGKVNLAEGERLTPIPFLLELLICFRKGLVV